MFRFYFVYSEQCSMFALVKDNGTNVLIILTGKNSKKYSNSITYE